MIDRPKLLSDLQKLLRTLETDLLERSDSSDVPEVGEMLRSDYDRAKQAERTAQSFEEWRSDTITQMASAWVLSGVFVRFLEDNQLIDPPMISGVGERLQRSRDEHEVYFRQHPQETDREYWLMVFDRLAKLPGTREIFGTNNRIRELPNWLSGDAAGELLRFFQRVEPSTGLLVHDFGDENWDTRFLGDLYQDLSEAARKKYALLQTPEFVESFILDRTLDPAIAEFGLSDFRMIDPACGSGHFLLGAFARLLDRWLRKEPGTNVRELAQRSLNSIHGVDINPYAVAIARFRLLLAAMRSSGIERLRDAPAFRIQVVCGDSLLHGEGTQLAIEGVSPKDHHYKSEDIAELNRILIRGHYHAVVANPPYITPKDRALNVAYRKLYKTCHMKYSLAVPFMERIFQLAVDRGFTGQITANTFMKRGFGKNLIEGFLPKVELTHIIDSSLAYIPGHGTPTVILFGRHRSAIARTVRTVMGIKRENCQPTDPAKGLFWTSILAQIDFPGSESEFVTVTDSLNELFYKHPWSIGGGGAAELKEQLEEYVAKTLEQQVISVGFASFSGEDDVFIAPRGTFSRFAIPSSLIRPLVKGENVRDWSILSDEEALCPYDQSTHKPLDYGSIAEVRHLWMARTLLFKTKGFGNKSKTETGSNWWEWFRWIPDRYVGSTPITFAYVATHNHFVRGRLGQVFRGGASAPIVKLPSSATEDDFLVLLFFLNCSTGAFWMRQVFHDKGGGGIGGGIAAETWERFFEYDGTKIKAFPLPEDRPTEKAKKLDQLAQKLNGLSPAKNLNADRATWQHTIDQMITLQEELDWQCYQLYSLLTEDLTSSDPPSISLGQRAFEIVMARKMAAGELQTTWFDRHHSTPITEFPIEWSDDYKQLIQRRIEMIERDRNIALIEQPEYKRRWNTEPWDSQLERALRNWLCDRLETYFDFDGRMNDDSKPTAKIEISLVSIAQLADLARQDLEFLQIGELYRNDSTFNVQKLITELVEAESVPLLPILRYKPTGLRKRSEWEHTWHLQRLEDKISDRTKLDKDHPDYLPQAILKQVTQHEIGTIPVPPKYTNTDFQKPHYWKLRGKLDVPKERWVSFPHCNAEDGTMTITWAGYNHLQLAQAISAYFVEVQERLGGREDPRLPPLLANLLQLLPWLKQWHNDLDPVYNLSMGDYFESFIQDEARQIDKTLDEVRSWQPPTRTNRRR